jgi:hypothetical protein
MRIANLAFGIQDFTERAIRHISTDAGIRMKLLKYFRREIHD